MTHEAPPSILHAPAYGLLLGRTECHFCHASTPTAAVWVPSFEEHDDEGMADQGDGALLRYIERLDENTAAFVAGHALQGDHFVFSPDGPYWPQDDVQLASLRFIRGLGPLTAQASAGQSAWMDRAPVACTQA